MQKTALKWRFFARNRWFSSILDKFHPPSSGTLCNVENSEIKDAQKVPNTKVITALKVPKIISNKKIQKDKEKSKHISNLTGPKRRRSLRNDQEITFPDISGKFASRGTSTEKGVYLKTAESVKLSKRDKKCPTGCTKVI